MTLITQISTAVPPYRLTPEEAKHLITDVFPLQKGRIESVGRIVDRSGIQSRYSVFPSDYMKQPRDLTQDMADYKKHSVDLANCAVERCLETAKLPPTDIDVLITTSCTGLMMPSLDAYIMRQFGFRTNVVRLPITELGCMGGAAAIARAYDFQRAYPSKNIMLVSVEIPSLTYQHDDPSPANLVSSAIFGDGAACVLLEAKALHGIEIIDVESAFLPNSLDAMGFDLQNEGLHIVLSKDVPTLVREGIKDPIRHILARHSLDREDVSAWMLHPGGRKILEYIEEALNIEAYKTQPSWEVLRDYGNMSSATVLFVLQKWLSAQKMRAGEYGILMAFGPGLSAEIVLLKWI